MIMKPLTSVEPSHKLVIHREDQIVIVQAAHLLQIAEFIDIIEEDQISGDYYCPVCGDPIHVEDKQTIANEKIEVMHCKCQTHTSYVWRYQNGVLIGREDQPSKLEIDITEWDITPKIQVLYAPPPYDPNSP